MTVTVAELVRAHRAVQAGQFASLGCADITVVGATAGCGTTTCAVALADALGQPCRLVEVSSPLTSGLTEAADAELGVEGSWRVGTRGPVRLERGTGPMLDSTLPTLLDAGAWPVPITGRRVIVVGTATVPSLRRVEVMLDALHGTDILLAIVGSHRWPKALRQPRGMSDIPVHYFPHDRRFERAGICPAPLPSLLQTAAANLLKEIS